LLRACGCSGGLSSCSFGSKTVRARCPGPLEIGAGPPAYGAVPQRPSCVRLSGEGAFRQDTCRFRSATRSGCGCGSSGTLRSAERSLRHGARPCLRPGWRWTPSGASGTQSSARCCSTSRLHPLCARGRGPVPLRPTTEIGMHAHCPLGLQMHGDCFPPQMAPGRDGALGRWAAAQRTLFRGGTIRLERRRWMDAVGFVWDKTEVCSTLNFAPAHRSIVQTRLHV